MTLSVTLKDLFIDPISLETMTDPIINPCGHTFERTQLEGWIETRRVSAGAPAQCPLCKRELGDLVPNILIRQALEVLESPDNASLVNIEDLTDDERDQVQSAVDSIRQRRVQDRAAGIPDRLDSPLKYVKKVAKAVSDFYCSK